MAETAKIEVPQTWINELRSVLGAIDRSTLANATARIKVLAFLGACKPTAVDVMADTPRARYSAAIEATLTEFCAAEIAHYELWATYTEQVPQETVQRVAARRNAARAAVASAVEADIKAMVRA